MDNHLKTLISLYQEEKCKLEKLINECLTEDEYLHAHYYFIAMSQINGRLQTLQNIEDSNFDEKESELRTISFLEKQMEETDSILMKEYYSKALLRAKETLEKLNQLPLKTTNANATFLFDDVLIRLLDKEIKNVKLILKKSDNLLFAFTYSNKTLKVTLPYVKQLMKRWILHYDRIEAFRNLGFIMTENENKLVLTIAGSKQEIIGKVKLIFSKIVFDIFYFREFENESYFQFTEKGQL